MSWRKLIKHLQIRKYLLSCTASRPSICTVSLREGSIYVTSAFSTDTYSFLHRSEWKSVVVSEGLIIEPLTKESNENLSICRPAPCSSRLLIKTTQDNTKRAGNSRHAKSIFYSCLKTFTISLRYSTAWKWTERIVMLCRSLCSSEWDSVHWENAHHLPWRRCPPPPWALSRCSLFTALAHWHSLEMFQVENFCSTVSQQRAYEFNIFPPKESNTVIWWVWYSGEASELFGGTTH